MFGLMRYLIGKPMAFRLGAISSIACVGLAVVCIVSFGFTVITLAAIEAITTIGLK